jgi:hypothetical protein
VCVMNGVNLLGIPVFLVDMALAGRCLLFAKHKWGCVEPPKRVLVDGQGGHNS